MLEYEHIQPGTRVRVMDTEPREGVEHRYFEGVVVGHSSMPSQPSARALVVDCDRDVTWPDPPYSRVGEKVFVPMQLALTEYAGRVRICTERCDLV